MCFCPLAGVEYRQSMADSYVHSSGPEMRYARLVIEEGLTYTDAAAKMGVHEKTATRYRQRVRRYVEANIGRETTFSYAALYLLNQKKAKSLTLAQDATQ